MTIKSIDSFPLWQAFFDEFGATSFLPSWEWGEFQKSLGNPILRGGVFDGDCLEAIFLVIKMRSKRGHFLFMPHGPVFRKKEKIQTILISILGFLKKVAQKEKFDFIRIAPFLENAPENYLLFKNLGFKEAPIYLHAESFWVLPLFKSNNQETIFLEETELLSQMRKTTRYLIRKAQMLGLTLEKRKDSEAVDEFNQIYLETASREKFIPFSKDYLKKEFLAFRKTNNSLILLVKTGGHLLAGALILFTKKSGFYHQGASVHSKLPATYLLQWEAIKEAKTRHCHFYNFWGVFDNQSKRNPKSWQGLTFFKTGFGGKLIRYLPTQDFVLSPRYYLTYLWEKLLAKKRGI
ncbi:MAG: peptidoglycan bridge formation glycyltransferase FemA/FemB family protein [Patescibacteria group bacterium]|nr:peptidoglycan bridge formation glycyltransferase FemA/FemB family protein [Patescibacteria group bacterium]